MKLTLYTDGCARTFKTDNGLEYHAGWGLWGFDNADPKKDLWAFGKTGKDKTNNQAELQAVINAVAISTSLKATDVELNIDSTYVKDGCEHRVRKWASNGWKTATGSTVKNQDYWKQWLMTENKAIKNNLKITYKWVKGHSGVEGNEKADEYALCGGQLSADKVSEETKRFLHNFGSGEKPKEKVNEVKSCKSVKVKLPAKDPLVIGSKVITLTCTPLFTHTNIDGSISNVTYSTKYSNDPKVLDRELGVESADAMQCVTISNLDVDFQLKKVHELTSTMSEPGIVLPIVINWDKLTSANFRKQMFTEGVELKRSNSGYYYVGQKKDTETKLYIELDVPLSRIAKMPRRAWYALDHLESKYHLLCEVLNNEKDAGDIFDLTDYLIVGETNKNGIVKYKQNPDIKGATFLKVKPWYNKEICLTPMIDIVNFLSIGTILKSHPGVKFKLIKHGENNLYFKYSVVAISDNGSMIMNNPYTNVIYK